MIKKTLIICIKVLSLILIVLLMAYLFKTCRDFGYKVFSDRAKDAAGSPQVVEAVIHVDQGESLLEIGEELEFLSIIRDKYVFAVSARCMDATQDTFSAEEAVDCIPNTNPFLKSSTKLSNPDPIILHQLFGVYIKVKNIQILIQMLKKKL